MANPQLSEKVLELIKKSRIVSFATWQSAYTAQILQRFQAADDQGRYLTDEDLEQIQTIAGSPTAQSQLQVVKMLRDRVREIVDEARGQVLEAFPTITQPGGGLYPAARAEACWRDFWHFLRCITYGIAGQRTDYLSDEGLHAMQLLYQELQVPLNAMAVGLEGIKTASLKRVKPEQQEVLAPYYERLIERLKQFE
jgi:hypothetical protein